jgi:hypothetical protein
MLLILIAWSVLGRTKGISGGENKSSQRYVQTGEERKGFAIFGSYCSAESIKLNFQVITQKPAILIFAGEVNSIPASTYANPTIISRTFSANKCYPISLSANSKSNWNPPYTAIAIRTTDSYLNEWNSITSFYDGCTDGWKGERCDVEIREEKNTCIIKYFRLLPELIAILFLE